MPFSLEEYVELRPYLFHTTSHGNGKLITATRRLTPAAEFLGAAGRSDLLRQRRVEGVSMPTPSGSVLLRDQRPLIAANIAFEGGWTVGDLVEFLNRHVFFWPGSTDGPISYGRSHFHRYADERLVVLRIRLRSLIGVNPFIQPVFSAYNSGAARQNAGRPIPRGPRTFVPCRRFTRKRHEVKEVAFAGSVVLPSDAEFGSSLEGPWRRPWQAARNL